MTDIAIMLRRRRVPWRPSRHGPAPLGFAAIADPLLAITPASLVLNARVSPLLWLLVLASPLMYQVLPGESSSQYAPALAMQAGRHRREMPRGRHDA